MKKIISGIAAFLLSLSTTVNAGSYTIGVEALEYFPIYEGQGGSYKGYARDLIDTFGKSAGHTFTYQLVPVKRLFNEFLSGDINFKYPANPK